MLLRLLKRRPSRRTTRGGSAKGRHAGVAHTAYLRHLVELELSARRGRRIERLQKVSDLPSEKTLATHHETRLTTKRDSPRSATHHETRLTTKRDSPRSATHHETRLTTKRDSPRNATHHEARLPTKRDSPRNATPHEARLTSDGDGGTRRLRRSPLEQQSERLEQEEGPVSAQPADLESCTVPAKRHARPPMFHVEQHEQ